MKFISNQYIKHTLIPLLFKLRRGQDLWAEQDLTRHGIEVIAIHPGETVQVPATCDWNTMHRDTLPSIEARFNHTFVFKLDYATHKDCVKKHGAIVLPGGKALHTGINQHIARIAALYPKSRKNMRRENLLIAPWPHGFMSYGDWCMCVLPKVCRVLSVLSCKEQEEACIALPLAGADWARQYLEILGIARDRQIDTITENFGLAKSGTAYTVNAHSGFWLGPDDMHRMQRMIVQPEHSPKKRRFFISRKGGRKLKNEQALYDRIKQYGIEYIEDVPRTVKEQLELFHDAALIIGPHGAGLANALWSTHAADILEVQSSAWFFPSFRIMCAMNRSRYGVAIDRTYGQELRIEEGNNQGDLEIDPTAVETAVRQMVEST